MKTISKDNFNIINQDYYVSGDAIYGYCTPYSNQNDSYNCCPRNCESHRNCGCHNRCNLPNCFKIAIATPGCQPQFYMARKIDPCHGEFETD